MDNSKLIKIFKALSDKTRLRLFNVLRYYELNVNEIVVVVGMIQSGISRHLKILVESGLLTSRKEGSFTYFSSVDNPVTQPLIKLVTQAIESDPVFEHDLESAREMIHIRQNKTRRFFKSVAPRWDRLKKEVLGDLDLNGIILKNMPKCKFISDLGCGTGELIELLVKQAEKKMIGIDSSPEMLDQARSRLSDYSRIELRLGELEHLPMKNNEIDAAVMNMVLHYISQPKLAISEVFRALKPGGLFVLTDFEKHDNETIKEIMGESWLGFEQQEVITWLTDAGFTVKTVDSKSVNHNLVINIYTAGKL